MNGFLRGGIDPPIAFTPNYVSPPGGEWGNRK